MALYLRFGEIPQDEYSTIHYRDMYCGKEKGVSVYKCVILQGEINIVLPTKCSQGTLDSLTGFLFYSKNKPVYLVTGDMCGTGHDGEPLIRNVNILKDVTEKFWKDIYVNEDALHNELISLAEKFKVSEKNDNL